jgi:hypothetical protein
MGDDTAELLVSIRGDIQDLKDKFSQAKDTAEDTTNSMGESFSKLGGMIAEVFAAEKIASFFKGGIVAFAEFDKQLDITQANLERMGIGTADTKEQLENWAVSIQAATLYTKDEAVITLNKFVASTQDLAASLKLSTLAMDVASGSGMDLQAVTMALGQAYEGNTQGLTRFAKRIEGLKEVLDNHGDVIAFLQQRYGGFSKVIGNEGLAGALFHAETGFKELGEEMAKENQGVIMDVIHGFMSLTKWIGESMSWIAKMDESVATRLGGMVNAVTNIFNLIKDELMVLVKFYEDVFTGHFIQATKDLTQGSKRVFQEFATNWKSDSKATMDTMDEIWADGGKKSAKSFSDNMTNGLIGQSATVKRQAVQALLDAAAEAKDASAKMAGEWKKATADVMADEAKQAAYEKASLKEKVEMDKTAAAEANAAWVKSVNDSLAAKQKADADWKKFAKSGSDADKAAATASTKAFEDSIKDVDKKRRVALADEKRLDKDAEEYKRQMSEMELQTVDKTLNTLASLSKSKNKEIAEIAKDAAVAKATINTFESVTQALAAYPPPYSFIMAAATAIAGGIEIANIEGVALAQGGIVNAPTNALIGEGGEPEAVVPLSKAGEMGFGGGGGDTHNHTWNFPGVTNRSEAKAAGESAALVFIKVQQKSKTRAGNRNTSF